MKKIYSVLIAALFLSFSVAAQTSHTVVSGSYYYTPTNLSINVGDTVTWTNAGGLHNVNFDLSSITGQSFGNPRKNFEKENKEYIKIDDVKTNVDYVMIISTSSSLILFSKSSILIYPSLFTLVNFATT